MIDLFSIFSKGGIVLWCFQSTGEMLTPSVNALIRSIFLQERNTTSKSAFGHNGLSLKYATDNEFELVFVVAYQSVIKLSYVDKLLTDVQLEFRDRYKNVLAENSLISLAGCQYFKDFSDEFQRLLTECESTGKPTGPSKMKTFEESLKSQKTVASMIQSKSDGKSVDGPKISQIPVAKSSAGGAKLPPAEKIPLENGEKTPDSPGNRLKRPEEVFKAKKPAAKVVAKPVEKEKVGKKPRVWDGGSGLPVKELDFSRPKNGHNTADTHNGLDNSTPSDNTFVKEQMGFVNSMKGDLKDLQTDSSEEESEEEELDAPVENNKPEVKSKGFGLFSAFKSLVGSKKLTREEIQPALEKMREHLIGKNVAAEIAEKLCDSVATKLEGKVIGTFSGVTSTVKETLRESLVQLLSPHRRVNILRDIMEAKKLKRPYVIVFCGVNGVGKSTNLAKITFWLCENGHRVLIAACDTFRAGAVEQLRTHTKYLNALHADSVYLYEQGYGKDAAGIAAQAISNATERNLDVVLVDTAGRMQDNLPLMTALAKLIRVNEPDSVLFVGEALVGNEAVDQLVKFNQALADNATPGSKARLIDGIVLTKFDTIDDKVGAAISMTYITGQPIVFVGTGQTYRDLKNLNANAVVHSLLK